MSEAGPVDAFLAMGGYAFYVWPAYIVALAVIGGMALQTHLQWRRLNKRIRSIEAGTDARQ